MGEYEVTVRVNGRSRKVYVEASNPREAEDMAEEEYDAKVQGCCSVEGLSDCQLDEHKRRNRWF